MELIDKFANEALSDPYFHELFLKAEKLQSDFFFKKEEALLDERDFTHLLRFADILSHAQGDDGKNKAYKIISLLFDCYKQNPTFIFFAKSVLLHLGNFPALQLVENTSDLQVKLPLDKRFERIFKEEINKSPKDGYIFTDSQKQIFKQLKQSDSFSFSAPTSLGKSFIIQSYILYLRKNNYRHNSVILVPSRALISQCISDLRDIFKDDDNYVILDHPTIPEIVKKNKSRYIFVFTPERLSSYLANHENPKIDYLFIDEAHKLVSNNDSRSPIYYHAILQAQKKGAKLFFSSPNSKNPEVFLEIFEQNSTNSIAINTSPVAQNRYFLNLETKKFFMFSDIGNQRIDYDLNTSKDFFFWLDFLGKDNANIIYCGAKNTAIDKAFEFAKSRKTKNSEKINEVKEIIKDFLHKDYFLIDCLDKGVAFHFGDLPQLIRKKIEKLFAEREIDYLFCTSTLLEGVNLPTKNIFILSNKIGTRNFDDMDFWNLAGRAGRLTKELSGNIVCVADKEKNAWDDKNIIMLEQKDIKPLQSQVMDGKANFYKNLGNSLMGESFTRKDPSQAQKDIWNYYANLTLIYECKKEESVLQKNLKEKNQQAWEFLVQQSSQIIVPNHILSKSPTIKACYQNEILISDQFLPLPSEFDYEKVLEVLIMLSKAYNWASEESGGKNPLLRQEGSLKYYAYIMHNWMKTTSLKKMIEKKIKYHQENEGFVFNQLSCIFNKNNKAHINHVVNTLIFDIEHKLRFKIKNYFENYSLLMIEKYGEKQSGVNWSDFLEYGTNNYKIIDLQNLGITRHLAKYIAEFHADCLQYQNNVLVDIDKEKILDALLIKQQNSAMDAKILFSEFKEWLNGSLKSC